MAAVVWVVSDTHGKSGPARSASGSIQEACGRNAFPGNHGCPGNFPPGNFPKCGFVIVGSKGTIASYDYESTARVQTAEHPEGRDVPVDMLPFEASNPIAYFIDRLEKGLSPDGPLGVGIARKGRQIVDTAFASAKEKRTLPLMR